MDVAQPDEPTQLPQSAVARAAAEIEESLPYLLEWIGRVKDPPSGDYDNWLDYADEQIAEIRARLDVLRLHVDRASSRHGQQQITLGAAIARSMKTLREGSGRTQTELANDMSRLGFSTWKRITVAESESGKRRPTWEELLGYCVLFGCTIDILIGDIGNQENVVLNERRSMTASEFAQLLGLLYDDLDAGRSWDQWADQAAMSIAGIDGEDSDWRPAKRVRATYRRLMREDQDASDKMHGAVQAKADDE